MLELFDFCVQCIDFGVTTYIPLPFIKFVAELKLLAKVTMFGIVGNVLCSVN